MIIDKIKELGSALLELMVAIGKVLKISASILVLAVKSIIKLVFIRDKKG